MTRLWAAEEPPQQRRRGVGCQVRACMKERRELKEKADELERQLANEKAMRNKLASDEVKALQAEYNMTLEESNKNVHVARDAKYQRNKEVEGRKKLAAMVVAQTHTIAELHEKVAALSMLLEERAREARLVHEQADAERRRHNKEERRLEKQLAKTASDAFYESISSQERLVAAQQEAADAKRDAATAREEAAAARQEAMEEAELQAGAAEKQHEWELLLLEKKVGRAQKKAEVLREERPAVPHDRTPEEWAQLRGEAERQAARRERLALKGFLSSHAWRASDLAAVLAELGMLTPLFDTKAGTAIYFQRTGKLLAQLEREHFGERFALFLHFEMQLTLDKSHRIMQAASKQYDAVTDRYCAKTLFYDKYHKGKGLKVPRIVPPRNKIEPLLKKIYERIGAEPAEDGRIAFKSLTVVMQELLAQDPGKYGMPDVSYFVGGKVKLPIVISWDATGFGSQQFNTAALNNPFTPKSASQLRLLGLGNCDDGRAGTLRVLGPNVAELNKMIAADQQDECICYECICGEEQTVDISPQVFVVTDVSALRHGEHLINSGWCMCSRDDALRTTPAKPTTIKELHELLGKCESPTCVQRYVLSHNTVPGEALPRPCPMCTFGHDPSTVLVEQEAMYAEEKRLIAVQGKAGKSAFAKWRLAHAHSHRNVQPGRYGAPMLHHDLDNQLLDPLHQSELGIPKTPWKHGLLNNASDDARDAISKQCADWKHPIDCRRKEDNRSRAQKWFTGEAWASFCRGSGGSPGGPIAIATLVLIIAEDMQQRGVASGMSSEPAAETPLTATLVPPGANGGRGRGATGRGRGRGRASFTQAAATARAVPVEQMQWKAPAADSHEHQPTAMELAADAEDLQVIREMFGSRARTLINVLLAFDAYFNWYYPLKESVPFLCDMSLREERALDNTRRAIDLQEIVERVTIRKHKSFLFHGAIYKVSRDILKVGDVWATDLSPLELHNAETKRTASAGGSKRLATSSEGMTLTRQSKVVQGPAQLIKTKGYSTTMALSTLRKLLGKSYLRRGDGLMALPESRQHERLFGAGGPGRIKRERAAAGCLELMGAEYKPREDTCVKAFVRLLAARAASQAAVEG